MGQNNEEEKEKIINNESMYIFIYKQNEPFELKKRLLQ